MSTRWDLLPIEGEEAKKVEEEEKALFGSEITFTNKVIARKRWTNSCAEGNYEDGTPVMVFEIEPQYGDHIKRCKRNPHEERLLILDLKEKKGQGSNFIVATEPFEMKLSDWMEKHPVIEPSSLDSSWDALTPDFLDSFRSLIVTVIATRDLIGDFSFEASDVYVSRVNNKTNMRILKVKMVKAEVGDGTWQQKRVKSTAIKCMGILSGIVDKWLRDKPVKREFEGYRDLKLLLWMMKGLKVARFPPTSGRLNILLQSPIFHGNNKDDMFEFILGLEWRLQYKKEVKSGQDISSAMEEMGHLEVSDQFSQWYSEKKRSGEDIGFQLKECLDGGSSENPNVANRMLRIYRNVISHYKENKAKYEAKLRENPKMEKRDYKDASHLYKELEKLRPNGWAALHYVAVNNIELVITTESWRRPSAATATAS